MSTIKRAFLYIARKKSRTIMLFTILLVLFVFIFIGLSVRNNAEAEIENVINKLEGSFTLSTSPVSEKEAPEYWEYVENIEVPRYIGPRIDNPMIEKIMTYPEVVEYTVFEENGYDLIFNDLNIKSGAWAASIEEAEHYMNEGLEYDEIMNVPLEMVQAYSQSSHTIYALNSRLHDYFRQGAFELIEGRHINPDDKNTVLISAYLAETNGLGIGDTVIADCNGVYYWQDTDATKSYGTIDLEIAGIFDINFKQEPSPYTYENMYAENFIFTDYNTFNAVLENFDVSTMKGMDGYSEITFVTQNPAAIDYIIQELTSRQDIDWRFFTIEKDDFLYKNAVEPLNRIKTTSTLLVLVLSIGCTLILYFVIAMWTRSRKKEIGILMSIGIRKRSIVAQSFIECLCVGLVAIIISAVLAIAILPGVGVLLHADPGSADFQVSETPGEISVAQIAYETPGIAISATSSDIAGVFGIGLLVIAISVSGAAISITRQKPKDIISSD